ncbi:MAG TPA: ion transporter [Saprospiraceae bacterium]|nr:ion transporter [Saprospiraceae bacterium]HNT19857.1 ion transporter [Saprospiraceae bacterium]
MKPTQKYLFETIFEADTPAGKKFDVVLMVLIVVSVILANLETLANLPPSIQNLFFILEWGFTVIFTIEFILRLIVAPKPLKYILSPYGIIDLIAIVPTYLSLILTGTHAIIIVRALRLLRVFRLFEMSGYVNQGAILITAFKRTKDKIIIFLFFIFIVVNIVGALIYMLEHPANPNFDSLPRSVYWAIVTLTGLGYGDIVPKSAFGQILASFVVLLGYAIIAVPAGLITKEYARTDKSIHFSNQVCPHCFKEGHQTDAVYCRACGNLLN